MTDTSKSSGKRTQPLPEIGVDSSESSAPVTSVGPDIKEPKESSAKTPGAKPASARVAPYAVVGAGPTDTVSYSAAKPPTPTGPRKSLTVHHLQRRLTELGFAVADSDIDGRYGELTALAVSQWQASQGLKETGLLTRDEFELFFKGDPNVSVVQDTHADHA